MIASYLLVVTLLSGPVTITSYVPAPTFEACRSLIPYGIGEAFRAIVTMTVECKPDDRPD